MSISVTPLVTHIHPNGKNPNPVENKAKEEDIEEVMVDV